MKRIVISLVFALIVGVVSAWAQAPPPSTVPLAVPILAESDQRIIHDYERDRRVLELQIALLDAQVRPYLQSLVRPGYTLSRGPDGQWRYVAELKAPEAPKPEPPKK